MVRPCWRAPIRYYILLTIAGGRDGQCIAQGGKYAHDSCELRGFAPRLNQINGGVRHTAKGGQLPQGQPRSRAQPLYFVAYVVAVHHGGKSTKKTATKQIAAVFGRRAAQGYRSPNLRAAASKSVEQ